MTVGGHVSVERAMFSLRRLWCRLIGHDYERRDYIGDGAGSDSGVVFCRRCGWASIAEDGTP